jgi:chromosome segregation ATPase
MSFSFSQAPSAVRILGLSAAALALVGCATNPFQRATPREQVAGTVDKAAVEVAEIKGRIDGAVRSLEEIVNRPAPDLGRQMDQYSAAVADLRSSAEALRKRTADIEWDRELAVIHNEDLRTRSAERREEVAERFDDIREHYIDARDALQPLVVRLDEARAALALDPTANGVAAIRPTIDDLADDTAPARDALDALAEQLRRAGLALASTSVTPRGS